MTEPMAAHGSKTIAQTGWQGWLARLPDAWKFSLAVWAIFRLGLTGMGWLIFKMGLAQAPYSAGMYFGVEPDTAGWQGPLISVWLRWDAVHYIRIALHGYNQTDLSAFFPLFPWLGRLAGLIFGDATLGLIVVSNLCLLFSAVLLYTIAADLFNRPVAERAVMALLLYPFVIFLFAPFTESLSLVLILFTYQAMRKQCWKTAILAGFATGLARGTVIPLAALLLYQLWRMRRAFSLRRLFAPALAAASPLAGIASFLLWRAWMGFPAYDTVQSQYWQRHFAWPLETLGLAGQQIRAGTFPLIGYVHLALLAGLLAATIWMARRLPAELVIYQAVSLAFILTTTRIHEPFASLGRYSLILFPIYLAGALWADTPRKRLYGFAFQLLWMLLVSGQFFMWGWVG